MDFRVMIREQYYLLRQRKKFRECHGYGPDLEDPRSYSEKIMWRKVFDRNPLFPILQDKFLARQYVRGILGEDAAGKVLIPLYYATGNPEEIPFDDLPEEYVIKPNHGSGWVRIVTRSDPATRDEIIPECRNWLSKRYGEKEMEWAYSSIKPLVMVERRLKDVNGGQAPDFKFHVFQGTVKWVYIAHNRFTQAVEAIYDRTFKKMSISSNIHPKGPEISKPEAFEEMVAISEKLCSSLDYLRVDLYNVAGRIFFGEFTIYPSSGLRRFDPASFDHQAGEYWKVNRKYARRFRSWF